eukprot:15236324-Ditylum_brightwellii.AAC.1
MERSKQNGLVVCDKDDDVDDSVDNGVEDGDNNSVDDGVDDGDDGADNHLTHLSQVADCCLMERSKQNKHVVCNKDDGDDDDVGNGDNDSVEDGDDDSVDDGVEGAGNHLTHLSQAAD